MNITDPELLKSLLDLLDASQSYERNKAVLITEIVLLRRGVSWLIDPTPEEIHIAQQLAGSVTEIAVAIIEHYNRTMATQNQLLPAEDTLIQTTLWQTNIT